MHDFGRMSLFIVAFLVISATLVVAQQDGWKMIDRFYGFRYEISEKSESAADALIEDLVAKAKSFKCFGWAQKVPAKDSVVGEVRCMKKAGSKMKMWLEGYDDSMKQILVYADTKIRLHFTYFKVLDPDRNTCFLQAPHKCADENVDVADVAGSARASGGEL